jgi:hypothetical protein
VAGLENSQTLQVEPITLTRIEKSPFSPLRKHKARLTILQQATENSNKERQSRE